MVAATRLTLEQKIAQRRAELAQLEAKANARARKADTLCKIVIGGTVLAAMETDGELRNRVIALLHEKVTRPRDREAVSRWLASPAG